MPTVQHAIDVAASPERCWQLFSDVAGWPRWFPFLRGVRGEGLAPGGRLTLLFAAGPATLPIPIEIRELAWGARVRWVGGALGVRGDHFFSFAVNNPGTTRVTSAECFSGWGARLIQGPVLTKLDGEVHRSMERFRALVEATGA